MCEINKNVDAIPAILPDLRQHLFILRRDYFLFSSIAACAAASLAIGTLNGEQDT